MKRREFVEQLGIGSAILAAAASAEAAQADHEVEQVQTAYKRIPLWDVAGKTVPT